MKGPLSCLQEHERPVMEGGLGVSPQTPCSAVMLGIDGRQGREGMQGREGVQRGTVLTSLLERLQLLTLQLLDGGRDGLEGSLQALAQHHVIRLRPQPDAVLVFVSGQRELADVQLLERRRGKTGVRDHYGNKKT